MWADQHEQSERNEIVDRGNEDRDEKGENKTEREGEGKKEKGSTRERGSASLLL